MEGGVEPIGEGVVGELAGGGTCRDRFADAGAGEQRCEDGVLQRAQLVAAHDEVGAAERHVLDGRLGERQGNSGEPRVVGPTPLPGRAQRRAWRRRRALAITETELRLIAALAIIGERRMPRNG